jgi:DNA-binding beta-propeller fold protein YncE
MGDVKVAPSSVTGTTKHDSAGPYDLERRVFVICFDSRRIFVYDPKRHVFDPTVATGRGPHALAVDSARGLAYLGHFTDSYLGVISLDQRFPKTYATIVASIGAPKAPRTSK